VAHIRGSDPEQDHAHVSFAALMLHVRLRLGLNQRQLGGPDCVARVFHSGLGIGHSLAELKRIFARWPERCWVSRGFSPGRELAEAEAM
jgi:hypothetical protein